MPFAPDFAFSYERDKVIQRKGNRRGKNGQKERRAWKNEIFCSTICAYVYTQRRQGKWQKRVFFALLVFLSHFHIQEKNFLLRTCVIYIPISIFHCNNNAKNEKKKLLAFLNARENVNFAKLRLKLLNVYKKLLEKSYGNFWWNGGANMIKDALCKNFIQSALMHNNVHAYFVHRCTNDTWLGWQLCYLNSQKYYLFTWKWSLWRVITETKLKMKHLWWIVNQKQPTTIHLVFHF